MKAEPEVQTFYVVTTEDEWDDNSDFVIRTGTAKKVPSGWKILNGKTFYHYATFIQEDRLDFSPLAAIERKKKELRHRLRTALAEVTQAKTAFKAFNETEFKA
jgi:hypothetical protein